MPIVSGPRHCRIALINAYTGAISAITTIASVPFGNTMTIRYLFNDGLKLYGQYLTTAEQLDTLIPEGSGFIVSKQETPAQIIDTCFDGKFYWRLGATNVVQRSGPFVSDINQKSWAHGIGSPAGIMTDGKYIIVMET